MIFYAQNGKQRSIRLCENTRKFAYDSLDHVYGLDTLKTPAVALDDIVNFDTLSPLQKHDIAIERIAKNAPLRICEHERISGAATLGDAITHRIPATYKREDILYSVSHLTIDFESVLKIGVNGIRANAERSLAIHAGTEREAFLKSCINCLDAFDVWHARYLDALAKMPEFKANYENLQNVPHKPAKSFYEAVQSIWFVFAFVRLCGNWPGIGRIDYLLGDYLKKDLASGKLTLDEAREILAHFFIKGCEWVSGGNYGSGDAQHYQNILLCGVDVDGCEITNEVSYLVLDILEELGISDFPTTVRLNANSDSKLLKRVAEVMSYGGGILAVYNEDLIISSLVNYGYDLCEARKFANDGCWEIQIPGKTFFSYSPFDSLRILQQKTLSGYENADAFGDFESIYCKYVSDLREQVWAICNERKRNFEGFDENTGKWLWTEHTPCTVVSLFEDGCIQNGLSYFDGGPVYNVVSPHIGGLADTVNSLYAIKKLVYDDKKLALSRLFEILKSNWEGEEALRQFALNKYSYYGNDNDEVDALCARLLDDFASICNELEGSCGYRFPAGVSTFGRQLEWSKHRLAAPHGRRAGEVLAANASPTPNTDRAGATAIIRSYAKADLGKLVCGSALDIKLLPTSVEGELGIEALVGLMRGFVALGGCFMQPDVVDASILKDAQKHPECYSTLSVRISGWNARFVTLNKEWQDMVIAQNEH